MGKISLNLPTDDWLCKKIVMLPLWKDIHQEAQKLVVQFVRVAKSKNKLYRLHPGKEKGTGSVSYWQHESAKLNSSYSRIARSSGLGTVPPASCTISQDTHEMGEDCS